MYCQCSYKTLENWDCFENGDWFKFVTPPKIAIMITSGGKKKCHYHKVTGDEKYWEWLENIVIAGGIFERVKYEKRYKFLFVYRLRL